MLCVLIVEGMSVVVNVMLSLMSVMSPPPALDVGWLQASCDGAASIVQHWVNLVCVR